MRTVAHAALAVHHARRALSRVRLLFYATITALSWFADDALAVSTTSFEGRRRAMTHSRWPRRSILIPATLLLAILGPPVAVPAVAITPGDIIVANGVGGGLILVEPLLGVFRQGEGCRSGGGRQRHA